MSNENKYLEAAIISALSTVCSGLIGAITNGNIALSGAGAFTGAVIGVFVANAISSISEIERYWAIIFVALWFTIPLFYSVAQDSTLLAILFFLPVGMLFGALAGHTFTESNIAKGLFLFGLIIGGAMFVNDPKPENFWFVTGISTIFTFLTGLIPH